MNEQLTIIAARMGFEDYPQKKAALEAFIASDDNNPVFLLTLSRLSLQPQYPSGWQGSRGRTLEEIEQFYAQLTNAAMNEQGACAISGAKQPVAKAISHAGQEFEEWDRFYIDSYPSRSALLDVWASDKWGEALIHRNAAYRSVLVMPSTAAELNKEINSYSHQSQPMTVAEIEEMLALARVCYIKNHMPCFDMENRLERARLFAKSDDGLPINMLNLIREKDVLSYPESYTGEKGKSFIEAKQLYGKYAGAINAQSGATSIVGVSHVMPALDWRGCDNEEWQQFYFVYYPERRAYLKLLSAPGYVDALPHKLAGDEATLLIPMKHGTFNV